MPKSPAPISSSPEENEASRPMVTVNNDGENWSDFEGEDAINNEGEDWGNPNVDNEGENWENPNVDNEGEDWENPGIDNEGEDFGNIVSQEKPEPTNQPSPMEPTQKPTSRPTIDLMSHLEDLKGSYFCSVSWDTIDCENAKPCPSGNSKDCPKKQQCFSGAPCAKEDSSVTDGVTNVAENTTAAENNLLSNEAEEEVTTFCGSSWGDLIENCDDAKPCPSGTNADCPTGQSCFANACSTKPSQPEIMSPGHYNFAAMVGEIPSKCKDRATMSRNVGYWQSWSI